MSRTSKTRLSLQEQPPKHLPTSSKPVVHSEAETPDGSTSLLQQAHIAPDSLSGQDVLRLQRTIGNRAVMRLVGKSPARSVQRHPPPDDGHKHVDDDITKPMIPPGQGKMESEGVGGSSTSPNTGGSPFMKVDNQNFVLIGTSHGHVGQDLSGQVPQQMMMNSSVILEYPPLMGTGRQTYNEGDIEKVNDVTQKTLALQAGKNVGSGTQSIGGDGRKAFDQTGRLHALTIRHKERNKDYVFIKKDEVIDSGALTELLTVYAGACLGLTDGDPVASSEAVVAFLSKWLEYWDGTNARLVFTNTCMRVSSLAKQMDVAKRKAILAKVLSHFQSDIQPTLSDYKENAPQYKAHGFALDDLNEGTNDELVSKFNDAVCNLLLFSEALGSQKENVVVAFGGEHVKPLMELLAEIKKMLEK